MSPFQPAAVILLWIFRTKGNNTQAMELLNDILCDAAPEDTIQSRALADFEHALALEIRVCLQETVESFGVFESYVNYRSFLCTRISLGDWFVVSILRRALVCV